jgi:hypothetical protein
MTPESPLLGKISTEDAERARDYAGVCQKAFTRAQAEHHLLKRRLVYAQLASRLRGLANRVEGRPVLVFIAATACFGFAAPLLILCAFGLKGVLIGAGIGFLFGGVISAVFLYCPQDSLVAESLAQLPSALHCKAEHLEHLRRQFREASERYQRLQQIVESRKNRLLRTDWRVLTGIPFERFLADVFEELGYNVETTKASGDQGVDLVLVRDGVRIAVQAKGYVGSVGNEAVQQVYAGMRKYACTRCVAVTNSRFTTGARELATVNDCLLIAGDQISDLILGKIM